MKKIDYELKILELEERNKYLKKEYDWLWEQFKRIANVPENINDEILKILK